MHGLGADEQLCTRKCLSTILSWEETYPDVELQEDLRTYHRGQRMDGDMRFWVLRVVVSKFFVAPYFVALTLRTVRAGLDCMVITPNQEGRAVANQT